MTAKSLQEDTGIPMEKAALGLKELREARGLTHEDICQATKISIVNLEAMESGAFQRLPPPVYSRAYFKAYAKMLDLDEGQITRQYERYLAATDDHACEEEIRKGPAKYFCFPKKGILNASIVAVICVSGALLYSYFNPTTKDAAIDATLPVRPTEKPLTNIDNPVTLADGAVKAPEAVGGGSKKDLLQSEKGQISDPESITAARSETTGAMPPVQKPATLIIRAREKTWLRIMEDRKEAYQFMLQPGEKIERSALLYTVDIGNAGGVSVEYQGKMMDQLGKSGEVVHLKLP